MASDLSAAASAGSGSVERVRAALRAAGHADSVTAFPDGTRTSAEAAAAVGCSVAQIAKSMVFRTKDAEQRPVLVITSGANRVDPAKVAAVVGTRVDRPDATWVRQVTGFAIGGVAPVGHLTAPIVLLDRDLLALYPLWAAAGSPNDVFQTSAVELQRLSGGTVADVRQDSHPLPEPSEAL
jgi:prolyl-tRNA editing enzyme YbaK/EbsC (Cys-tRNA(Pro) deacylase)